MSAQCSVLRMNLDLFNQSGYSGNSNALLLKVVPQ